MDRVLKAALIGASITLAFIGILAGRSMIATFWDSDDDGSFGDMPAASSPSCDAVKAYAVENGAPYRGSNAPHISYNSSHIGNISAKNVSCQCKDQPPMTANDTVIAVILRIRHNGDIYHAMGEWSGHTDIVHFRVYRKNGELLVSEETYREMREATRCL